MEKWDRQKNESSKAFIAFQKYRDMGRERSHKKVAALLNKSSSAISKISMKWKWKERANAFDAWEDQKRIEARIKAIQEMETRHVKQAMIYQKVSLKPAQALLKKPDRDFDKMTSEKLFDLSMKAAKALDSVVGIERRSRGEADHIVKSDITSKGEKVHVVMPLVPQNNKDNKEENDD